VASLTYLLFALDIGPLLQLINGVLGTDVNFLADPAWFRPLIVLQDIWKNTGWGTIIFLAALATVDQERSEEHTSELQSLMRISYAVFCLKKKKKHITNR